MKIADYPRVTIILRNVPQRVVDVIVATIDDDGLDLAVEVTRNSTNFDDLSRYARGHPTVRIGAGTVLTEDDARAAIDAGCQFVLSPVLLPTGTVELCHGAGLIVVPGAYTPTEIHRARESGADIVKLFPVRDLSAHYVRDVKAPLGEVPIMGVGGVSIEAIPELLAQGVDYVGIGSGFLGSDLGAVTDEQVRTSLHRVVAAVGASVATG